MLKYWLKRLGKIHAFGYRARPVGDSGVHILGRNSMGLPMIVLLAGALYLPVDVLFIPSAADYWEEPVIVVLMFLLILLCLFGIGYFLLGLAVRTEILFSDTDLSWRRQFMIGSKVRHFDYTDLASINFSTYTPPKAAFKCVQISLVQPDGTEIRLIQKDGPMYSWQGRKAFHQLRQLLTANGHAALLGAEPDFSWEGDAAFDDIFSPDKQP
jgi:hypothetical protein